MNSTELLELYRTEAGDVATPYLWSDEELFRYMDQAYKQFVRLTGGIGDFTSAATLVPVVAGQATVNLDPSILTVRRCTRVSDGAEVEVLNIQDVEGLVRSDYGAYLQLMTGTVTGAVRYIIIGQDQGTAQLVNIPAVNDTLKLVVYRLPMNTITGDDQSLAEVKEMHHPYLLLYMRHLALLKQDAEVFDPKGSASYGAQFREYCAQVRAEWDRYRHKPRIIAYGGI